MKPLSELLQGIGLRWTLHRDASIRGIQVDSRRVQQGDLFVALTGAHHDGHHFLSDALARGAAALLVSNTDAVPPDTPAWAWVENTRDALWRIAQRFYDDPSRQLLVVGVTGTNGKTTTTYLMRAIFETAGLPCALIGTLGAQLPCSPTLSPLPNGSEPSDSTESLYTGLTTPETFEIQAILKQAVERGARAAVMEVSSHALDQRRADGVRFDAAIFTNLTQDHLDYHPTMEAYAQAKLRLFTELARQSGKPFRAIINLDAEWGAWFAERAEGDLWTYGTHPHARVRAEQIQLNKDGIQFMVHIADREPSLQPTRFPVQIRLSAPHNVQNTLGAVAAALSLRLPVEAIQQGLLRVERVPGRFERVPIDAPFEVIVDYAHTPDALARLLQAARMLQPSRLTLLFGCGGDRDPTKRPKMGAIAAELADRVILTSDNPRTEPPERILQQILEGIPAEWRHKVVAVEPDRRTAIALALQEAVPGEIILLAGKGHEEYQIIGTVKFPFSDRQTVLELIGAKRA
ncbi:UDP-N-acetylmuramoyl-L-alanyl-D-glutamate--2, 6-diaminopimelate ligase [bacterium HR15]|nr:UDP-N-acetylmuramoyl-L-alanyl-D-glutamate--2, 6-diaminopimelate ligase [bacterium HR15]